MSALLKAELLKLSTTRTFAALADGGHRQPRCSSRVWCACSRSPRRTRVLTDVFTTDTSGLAWVAGLFASAPRSIAA